MPEVGIGFAPDVGGPYLLARAPGELGTDLALTGERIGCEDAVLCGLADRIIAVAGVAELVGRLREDDVEAAVAATPAPAGTPPAVLAAARVWIDASYSADTAEEILERLRARPEADAARAAELIATRSPTALKVALRALRQARGLPTLEACLAQELRASCAFLDAPDSSKASARP